MRKIALVLLAALIFLLLLLPKQKTQSIKCPENYCETAVKGSGPCPFWTNKTGQYYEQKCYEYPKEAKSLEECEKLKKAYYLVCGVRAT